MQDELSERVQELEEELAMALTEVNKTKDTARQLAEVSQSVIWSGAAL